MKSHCYTQGKFLGYYFGLETFLATHPLCVPGNCFINGETQSLWIWDAINRKWVDSNRLDSPFQGLVENPQTFDPKPKPGIKAAYLYFAPKSGTVTFEHLQNADGENGISVTVSGSSIVMLYWDGDYWSVEVIPMENNIEELIKKHRQDVTEMKESIDKLTPIKIPVKSYGDDGEVIFENLQILERLLVDAKNTQKEVVVTSGSEMTPASLSYDDYFTSFVLSFFGADKRQHEITFSVEPDGFKIAKQVAFAHSEFIKAKAFSDTADYPEI